jgi:4-hydroxy-tetrahydrodipicolinate synthase
VAQTPFDPSGAVDFGSIDTLSAFYYRHGARGLTVLGVSGEAEKLSSDETIAVASRFVAASGGKPIIVGVSNPSIAQLVAITLDVMKAGASGVMISPQRGVQTDEELFGYFSAVFDRIGDVPTVLQDFPFASGVKMSVDAMLRLVELFPQIQVIKEEDIPSCSKVSRLRQSKGRRFQILTGNNALYLPFELERGADGPMAGFSFPEVLAGVYDRIVEGDRWAAFDLFDRYLPLLRYEAQGPSGVAVRKEVMRRRGALASATMRRPGPVLGDADQAEIDFILERIKRQDESGSRRSLPHSRNAE